MARAHGFVETRGLVAAVVAADAMAKAADVELRPAQLVGDGLVTVPITGDVAAVSVAVDAGADAAVAVGEVVSRHVIALPFEPPRLDGRPAAAVAGLPPGAAPDGPSSTTTSTRKTTKTSTRKASTSTRTSRTRSRKGTDKESKNG